ncbi:MAG: family 43 glycosylhydrolase [Verrucomicrobia bacterium]|nr:family 43 glycosylhydrolase [Verrucomicrobiota bacterium]
MFKVELDKDSPIGEASIREHAIVWHPQKKKYYLLADVIPLSWKLHPNTYDTEIHLFSSPDLSEWKYHGVAIEKGKAEDAHDKFGVASPVAAALVNGVIYCPYSARRTPEYTGRSVGLAYSSADPEKLPWNKTQRPISDLPGEDDDVAIVKDDKTALFHLYHRTALFHSAGNDYNIVHSQSATPLDEDSWTKAVPVIDRPGDVRAQELTGVALMDGRYHLFVMEHLYKGGVKIAHLVSNKPAGPFRFYQKNQRWLSWKEQAKNVIYSGHITPVVKNGELVAFFWTVSQDGKRYGLLGHPVLNSPIGKGVGR